MNRRQLLELSALSSLGAILKSAGMADQLQTPSKIAAKKNLVIFTSPLGFNKKTFFPTKNDLNSAPLIECLKEHHSDLTVFKEISQPEIGGGHLRNIGLLTLNTNQRNGPYISLDQFAKEKISQVTRYKNIHMGAGPIVWDKNSQQLPTLLHEGPKEIYNKLFTEQASSDALQEKLEVLKAYKANMNRNSYSNSSFKVAIQELEKEIATDILWSKKTIPQVKVDTALHLSDNHKRGYIMPVPQHLELVHLGLKHKRGQVFVVAPPAIDKTITIGVKGSYHGLGHQASSGSKKAFEDMLKIETYIMNSIASFLTSMKKSKLLNDTIVLVMGSFCDPGRHSREFTPALIAGGGFKHQGLVECKDKYRLSQLYVSILHQMGIDVDEFASFKGDLDKVLL